MPKRTTGQVHVMACAEHGLGRLSRQADAEPANLSVLTTQPACRSSDTSSCKFKPRRGAASRSFGQTVNSPCSSMSAMPGWHGTGGSSAGSWSDLHSEGGSESAALREGGNPRRRASPSCNVATAPQLGNQTLVDVNPWRMFGSELAASLLPSRSESWAGDRLAERAVHCARHRGVQLTHGGVRQEGAHQKPQSESADAQPACRRAAAEPYGPTPLRPAQR